MAVLELYSLAPHDQFSFGDPNQVASDSTVLGITVLAEIISANALLSCPPIDGGRLCFHHFLFVCLSAI